jgi:LPXTG-motif cell wall-anchored protein
METSALTAATSPQGVLALYQFPDDTETKTLYQYYGPGGTNLFETLFNRNAPVGGWILAGVTESITTAQLIARGMLYTPGKSYTTKCPGAGAVGLDTSTARGVGAVGSLGTLGVSSVAMVSSVGGASSLGFAAAGTAIGSALGFATLGLGLAIGPLLAIIEHHEHAVQAEDSTICSVANAVNASIPQIDQAVASGSISAAQGVRVMASLVQQMNAALLRISGKGDGSHPCNAGCVWQAILNMHLDFVNTFYTDLSPMKIPASVPPGSYAPYAATASVVSAIADKIQGGGVGSAYISNSTAGQNAANLNNAGSQNGTFSSVPNILTLGTGTNTGTSSSTWIILIGLVALGAFLLLHKG